MAADSELARFEQAVAKLAEALNQPSNTGNQSTITIAAGGTAVWAAVTACAVMLAMNLCLLAMLINHDRKIDDLRHVLNAIYMMAPQLKP